MAISKIQDHSWNAVPRRGMAIFMVLGAILVVTLLGFAGMTLASRDSQQSGSLLDLKTRDESALAGLNFALGRMQADPVNTAAQLSNYLTDIADSVSRGSIRDQFKFDGASFELVPHSDGDQYQSLGAVASKEAATVRLLGLRVGSSSTIETNGMEVTLQATGRGRDGSLVTVQGTYRMLGLSARQDAILRSEAAISNALFLKGNLKNTNIGNDVEGDVYVGGDVHLNAGASQYLRGRFKVNGKFSSDAPLTVEENSWIGGDISVNASAPMHFMKNLGVSGGFQHMDAELTVDRNLNVYGVPVSQGPWNPAGKITTGGQFYLARQYVTIPSDLTIGAGLYFGNGFKFQRNRVQAYRFDASSPSTSNNDQTMDHSQLIVDKGITFRGNSVFVPPYSTAKLVVNQSFIEAPGEPSFFFLPSYFRGDSSRVHFDAVLFHAPIMELEGGMNAMVVDFYAKFFRKNQRTFSTGRLVIGNALMNTWPIDSNDFGVAGHLQWQIKTWMEFEKPLSAGMYSGSRVDWVGSHYYYPHDTPMGGLPGNIFGLKGLTSVDVGMRTIDSLTALADNPPDTFVVSAAKSPLVEAAKIQVTDRLCDSVGISKTNWGASEFNRMYAYLARKGQLLNGYMVLQISASSSLGAVSASAGETFTGKGVFIVERSIDVNGKWPASADSRSIQVINVRGVSGKLGQFGSQGDFYGVLYFENDPGDVTQSWGVNSHFYGTMQFANGGSYTGNSGSLTLKLDHDVLADVTSSLPGALRAVNGTNILPTPIVTVNTRILAPVSGPSTRVQFLRIGEYR